jgi:hypothetical protein
MLRNLTATVALLTVSTSLGCITPGTYRIYRVAQSSTESSAGCFPGGPPADSAGDSSTFKSGMTFAIYAHDSDTFFLDLADESLQGKKDGDYTFEGTSIDVTPDPDATTRVLHNGKVKLDISGRKISGTTTVEDSMSCTGANCPAAFQCITTTKFEGSEIKDVDLEHPV